MGTLENRDRAFCSSEGLTYVPPDPPISLEQFEADGPYYQNQGPAQGEPSMWTFGLKRYGESRQPSDTSTSKSEWVKIVLVALVMIVIASILSSL